MLRLDEIVYAQGRRSYLKKSALFGVVIAFPWAVGFAIFMQKSAPDPTISLPQFILLALAIALVMFPFGFALVGWLKWHSYERKRAPK